MSFPFLDPKNIKDKKKRRPDEEGYDATTIYIPESFLKEQTVCMTVLHIPCQNAPHVSIYSVTYYELKDSNINFIQRLTEVEVLIIVLNSKLGFFLSQPAQRQWWELKSEHFDTVLFFKMGKFYELFHMDAVLSVEKCGLVKYFFLQISWSYFYFVQNGN